MRRATIAGVRSVRVIDHSASSRKGVRSAALVGSQAVKRTSAPKITAAKSVRPARMNRSIPTESPVRPSGKETETAVTGYKLMRRRNPRNLLSRWDL